MLVWLDINTFYAIYDAHDEWHVLFAKLMRESMKLHHEREARPVVYENIYFTVTDDALIFSLGDLTYTYKVLDDETD